MINLELTIEEAEINCETLALALEKFEEFPAPTELWKRLFRLKIKMDRFLRKNAKKESLS